MIPFTWSWQSVGGIALMLLLVIVIHELGHFVTAKRAGICVEEFAVGFGPRLLSWRRGETLYSLRLIPAGGFVRMAGMTGLEEPPHDGGSRGFIRASLGRRAVVILAGGVMNLVLAGVLFSIVLAIGTPAPGIEPGGALAGAGVRGGVSIVGVGGHRTTNLLAVRDRLQQDAGRPVAIQLQAYGGQRVRSVRVQPQLHWVNLVARTPIPLNATITAINGAAVPNQPPGQLLRGVPGSGPLRVAYRTATGRQGLGTVARRQFVVAWTVGYIQYAGNIVLPQFTGPPQPLPQAVAVGFLAVPLQIGAIFTNLWTLVAGHAGSGVHLTGPIGIADATSYAAQVSPAAYLSLVGLISINLGLFNLLPIPFLDGGRFAFIALEWIRRRRFDPRREAMVHLVGLALILMLAIYVTYGDISRLVG
ncbi:MAG TPA: site-2 protease family protein [Candidatus Dormibacteraeota bacterium]|nr:site-2 protease family protein [Candidatus Dormibacteraeota bacterium]